MILASKVSKQISRFNLWLSEARFKQVWMLEIPIMFSKLEPQQLYLDLLLLPIVRVLI